MAITYRLALTMLGLELRYKAADDVLYIRVEEEDNRSLFALYRVTASIDPILVVSKLCDSRMVDVRRVLHFGLEPVLEVVRSRND